QRASTYRAALQDTVSAYDRLGGQPGSMAAEYAAHSRFLIVDPSLEELEGFSVNPGPRATVSEPGPGLNRQIQDGARRTQTTANGYEPILAYRRPTWTIAALTRQSHAYEILAHSVLNATITMPSDLQRQISRTSADVHKEVRIQFEDQ